MKKQEITFEMVTTRGGDRGETSLYNGERRRKDDFLFEVLGDLDELNAAMGVARAAGQIDAGLAAIQKKLLVIGAVAATPERSSEYASIPKLTAEDVKQLEKREYDLLQQTHLRHAFICPGESAPAAFLDSARTIARRCERRIVTLIREYGRTDMTESQRYINRLSDYLFILARHEEQN